MTEFEQNEQNPLEEHDFFIENTIEDEEGSSIFKIAILILIALGLLIGGYLLFFSGNDEGSVSATETTEISNDTTTTDDTSNALESAAVDPNAEATNSQADNNTEATSDAIENNGKTDTDNTENSVTAATDNSKNSTVNTNTDLHYFVIRGAFSEETNAQKSVEGLKTAGHNAVIVGKNKAGLFMVAYEGFVTIGEAKTKLAEVRSTQGDAWIYKK